jgi:hypothetical protein
VRVEGDSTVVTTGPDGRFALRDVPYGTLAIEARSLGFVPQERDVDVLADAPGHVTFSMAATKNVLDTVRTYALDASGFEQRRKAGWGRFLDADDIQRKRAFDVGDIVRSIPGVTVGGLSFHAPIRMRALFGKPCTPRFYLDGRQLTGVSSGGDLDMFVAPQDIGGVEVYASPTETPPQFKYPDSGCGAIVMWTLPPGRNRKDGR